ncbi:MAG: hypothetical protein JXX14_12615 [Deltaproteobacteria bacterium]|nr:hypothetical protein [Deltaproteobacteria bacterium]
MIVIGIDENGLGPVLGPMVVTACAFRASSYNTQTFWTLADAALPADDSKVVFKQNKKVQAEQAVLKWLQLFNQSANDAVALYDRVSRPLKRPCPGQQQNMCRPAVSLSVPQFGASVPKITDEINARFNTAGIETLTCAAFTVCPGTFNQTLKDKNLNKLKLDFLLMLQLTDHIRRLYPCESVLALCGKVGGTRCYLPWFEFAKVHDATPIHEEHDESRYAVGTDFEIAFIKNSDALHLPVAVASMVGKYLRELQMTEINELLLPGEKHVSGYRDTRTRAFIQRSAQKRLELGLPERCFSRNC